MAIINQLSEHVTNLIAAGEVVERAASVVKELVENSIDANSTQIAIHLVDSGVKEIKVIDNGDGMDELDARMCVMPHATSKIKDPNDLFAINTLGFRGEALPSIVAVSNFRLTTSQDGYHGYMYSLKGGAIVSEAKVSHSKGTEITVKDLFYNTPARLQNLQSQNVELSYITDYITKIALAKPFISFLLTNNDKVLMQTNGNGEQLEVVASIIGPNVAKNMLPVADGNGAYSVSGYISNLSVTRSNKSYMYLFVNGRVVRSYNINNAIIKGYDTLLMGGKYPLVILNIEAYTNLVDVNVHPTKAEVRFSDEASLLNLITNMVNQKLKKVNLAVGLNFTEPATKEEINTPLTDNNYETKPEEQEKTYENPFYTRVPTLDDVNKPANAFDEYEKEKELEEKKQAKEESLEEEMADVYANDEFVGNNEPLEKDETDPFASFKTNITETPTFTETEGEKFELKEEEVPVFKETVKESFVQQKLNVYDEEIVDENEERPDRIGKLFYIGQLFGTYLLCQTEDDLVILDQHAAAERVNFEKILGELEKQEKHSYDLLVPFTLEFNSSDVILIHEKMDVIEQLGIIMEDFGTNTFKITRIPVWIFRGKEEEFVEEIITQIIHGSKTTKTDFLKNLSKSLACKKSIKGNEFHSTVEIEYLLDDLRKTSDPFTCPHGRPIFVKFNKYEIDKWFKRIV